jgi:hypothetical protein
MLTKALLLSTSISAGLTAASNSASDAASGDIAADRAVETIKALIESGQKVLETSSIDASATNTYATEYYYDDNGCDQTPMMVLGYINDACLFGYFAYTGCESLSNDRVKIYFDTFSTGSDCQYGGSSYSVTYSNTGDCSNGATRYVCGSQTKDDYGETVYDYYSDSSCGDDKSYWAAWAFSCYDDNTCTYAGSNSMYYTVGCSGGSSDDKVGFCFHEDTKIDYKGVEYTFEELKAGKEPECTVPHTPSSKGVVISTSCDKTVRVTDTHLMATTKGFQLAYSLKAGDVLFGDYGKDMCTVKSVEKEKSTQQYFGLNCVHSEVLASGLRASTFGDFHTLPSWYMTYVGGLVGSEAASSLGEYVAEWWYRTHKLLSV